MPRVIQVYPDSQDTQMKWEKLPFDMWLPFEQHKSQVFTNKLTGRKLHRFDAVIMHMEDDDDPEGCLIEEEVEMPCGSVGWSEYGLHYANPLHTGDTIQVLDRQTNKILFTETIDQVCRVEGWEFSLAMLAPQGQTTVEAGMQKPLLPF